jgi:DNA polymerase/3'-5' exonuclease PolX
MMLEDALRLATQLRDELAPACERIEIAGSVRRRSTHVGDIELVAIPKMHPGPRADLFGDRPLVSCLDEQLDSMMAGGRLSRHEAKAWGPRYRRLRAGGPERVQVDLFIVLPPAEWGPIFTIRTGPAKFSADLVARLHRWGRRCVDGRVIERGLTIPCPEEEDFFRLAGAKLIAPWVRGVVEIERDPGASPPAAAASHHVEERRS